MATSVLLTGISGFLGSHTAIQLLNKGYAVTGTLRDLSRADALRKVIAEHTQKTDQLHFVEAELDDEQVWDSLTRGAEFVQHIASPFPRTLPKHEDELIKPAKAGVLNVLKAASKNGVKRVVLTSSSAAVLYGKQKGIESGTYNEQTWTDASNTADTTPYFRSKVLAEKAGWDFVAARPSSLEFVSVLPGAILGPVLEDDFGTSANIVLKLLDGSIPALPNIGFDSVDVRSVADLLIKAMEQKEAAGERFLCTAGYLSFKAVSALLKEHYPDRRIPSATLPDFITRLFALFDKTLEPVLLDLGKERKADSKKAREVLNWKPLSNKEAVISCAESLIKLKLVK